MNTVALGRSVWRRLAVALFVLTFGVYLTTTSRASECQPLITLTTKAGDMTLRLFPDAAPDAVRAVESWANEALMPAAGGLVGRTFDYTKASVELRARVPGAQAPQFVNTIDAVALGLHKQHIDNIGAAMNVMQRQLLPAYRRHLSGGPALMPALEEWLGKWFDTYSADHLIGESQQTINEALGYRYERGVRSRPVKRGSVMLVPTSANVASAQLSIALTDMPQRTGRWMVVGEVVDGLDTARQIAAAPLTTPRHQKPGRYAPLLPVSIDKAATECAAASLTDDPSGETL